MTNDKSSTIIPRKLYRDQLVTIADLESFKEELLLSLAALLKERAEKPPKRWLKSHEVRKLLGISDGTLQAMRVNGTLPFTKIGNLIYYDQDELNTMLAGAKARQAGGGLPPRR